MVRRKALAWTFAAALLIGCGSGDTDTVTNQGTFPSNEQSTSPDEEQTPTAAAPVPPATGKTLAATVAEAWKPPPAVDLPEVFAEDLRFTPPYAYLVGVVRPAKILESKGVADLPLVDSSALPFKPSDIERAVVTIYPRGLGLSEYMGGLGAAFVIQLRHDVSPEQVVASLNPRAQPYADRIYYDPPGQGPALGFPDDRTVLLSADTGFIFDQMRATDPTNAEQHALAPFFAELDPDAHAVVALDLDKLRQFADAFGIGADFVQPLEPLGPVDAVQLSVNLARPDGLVLRVQSDDPESLNKLALTAKTSAREQLEAYLAEFRAVLGEGAGERIESVENRLQALAESLTVQRDDGALTVQCSELPAAVESLQLVAAFGGLQSETWRAQARDLQLANAMLQVGLAILNYHDVNGELPRDIVSEDGKPLLSWRVAILPYMEGFDVHRQFRLDEPWDSEHNLQVLRNSRPVYPSRGAQQPGKTSIQMVIGKGTGGAVKKIEDLQDAESTLAVIETSDLVEWTRPGGFVFDPENPSKGLRPDGSFGITHSVVRMLLTPDMDPALLRSLFLDDGSEVDVERLRYQFTGRGRSRDILEPARLADNRFDELMAQLDGDDEAALVEALTGLAHPQPPAPDARAQRVLDKVTPLLKSESPRVRFQALRVIDAWSRGGSVDWQAVTGVLTDRYETNRWAAIRVLAEHRPDPEVVRALACLPWQDGSVAAPLIRRRFADIAADAMVPLLDSPDSAVRAKACLFIGGTGNESHVARIKAMLEDNSEVCRKTAERALENLQRQGPLATALAESPDDLLAAVKKVAQVETDENGDVIEVDLTETRAPHQLARSDFAILARLPKLRRLYLADSWIMAADLALLKDLPLEELHVTFCVRLGDSAADALRQFKSLRKLYLDQTNVGDATAAAIGELEELRELGLSSTRVGDAGLAHLGKLKRLEFLDLTETRISDQGLAALAGHPSLNWLRLIKTGITDGAVEHLATLKNLEEINIHGSGVTADGRARLRQALPNCEGLNPRF